MNELTTVEGVAAWRLLTTGGGQWVRAGMDGTIVGLDVAQLLARPSSRDCDTEMLEYLLTAAEPAAVTAINKERD